MLCRERERDDVMISDIKDALCDATKKLRDLKRDETELLFEAKYRNNGEAESTNLPATQRFKEMNKLTEKNELESSKSLKTLIDVNCLIYRWKVLQEVTSDE